MEDAAPVGMRDVIAERKAAGSLHRWLRRAALSAIPLAGLAGCGSQCDRPDYDIPMFVDGGVPWAPGSQHSAEDCSRYCGSGTRDVCFTTEITGCVVSSQTEVSCHNHYTFCYPSPCGRLPAGLRRGVDRQQVSEVAAHICGAAHLEGAAVLAFQALERELLAHAAPADLVARARSAQRDERRHHAVMSKLATGLGGRVRAVQVEAIPVRTLLEVARENAVEGCVRETYGAAVAVFQGECAGDARVRGAMRSIAIDEAEHASLGWALDAWACARLSPGDRARVADVRREACELLLAQTGESPSAESCATLGLPDTAAAKRLIGALSPLWT